MDTQSSHGSCVAELRKKKVFLLEKSRGAPVCVFLAVAKAGRLPRDNASPLAPVLPLHSHSFEDLKHNIHLAT